MLVLYRLLRVFINSRKSASILKIFHEFNSWPVSLLGIRGPGILEESGSWNPWIPWIRVGSMPDSGDLSLWQSGAAMLAA